MTKKRAFLTIAACCGALGLSLTGASPASATGPIAGYSAQTTNVVSVTATVVLPTFTCTRAEHLLIFVTSGGATATGEAGIELGCGRYRTPTMQAIAYVPVAGSFQSGQTVDLTVTCGSTGVTSSVENVTTGHDFSDTVPGAATCSGFIVGEYDLVGSTGLRLHPGPIPHFSTITFSNVTVNGGPLSSTSPSASNYYANRRNQILTGPIVGAGNEFVTTRD